MFCLYINADTTVVMSIVATKMITITPAMILFLLELKKLIINFHLYNLYLNQMNSNQCNRTNYGKDLTCMSIPIIFPIFIILLALLAFKRNNHAKHQKETSDAFLAQERLANSTRRQDISALDYLNLSLDMLPMGKYQDAALSDCEDTLHSLIGKRIINLSDKSNTELKLLYGPTNLDALTEYDNNFVLLAKTLVTYAQREDELEHFADAITILEYAMTIQSDISQNYLHLARLYKKTNMPEKITGIYTALENMPKDFAASTKAKLDAFDSVSA